MFQPPDHYHNLSLRLSEVFDDIGVNEILVIKKRRLQIFKETIETIPDYLDNTKIRFNFGSQTEASTTTDLHSDYDILYCDLSSNVIQDWYEWEVGKKQFLMIQDETTSPGYCLLQLVRDDVPQPKQDLLNTHCFIDDRGRMLMRHSLCLQLLEPDMEFDSKFSLVRHGPAVTIVPSIGIDIVHAIHCLSWPKEANPWLQQENASGWPTADMKRYSAERGCFIVPVGSTTGLYRDVECTGMYEDVEWRISTSLAERCLMFSLNMTQLRCYILMKMIIKCYIKPHCEEAISSFMCKNVLFHIIARSRPSQWRDCNLITCLNQCLQGLFNCILTENCPHFMIPRNNLLAGKLSAAVKQQLLEIMCTLTGNIEQTLLGISIDNLGSRILKSGSIYEVILLTALDISKRVGEDNLNFLITSISLSIEMSNNFSKSTLPCLVKNFFKLCQLYLVGGNIEQKACRFLTPFLCSSVSSMMASANIQQYHSLSQETLLWFSAGSNSDFPFLRLKLASALYCVGDLERCEVILVHLERQRAANLVLSLCSCYDYTWEYLMSGDFLRHYQLAIINYFTLERDNDEIIHKMSFCVRYFPSEVNCIPAELKFELFRSTAADLTYRTAYDDWMDCAVVDSLPYLYFLQYKVYSQLRRPADQYRALDNLASTIASEQNLGHRETALNLLGQCMQQENRQQDALRCFMLSLNVRGRNNAAKWHISRMLARLLRY